MPVNLYSFGGNDPERLLTRIRRVEIGNQYLRAGNIVPTSGQYRRVVDTAVTIKGQIASYASGVSKIGSMAPSVVSGGFGFAATTSSITWYWDGTNSSSLMTMRRPDGSYSQIPRGSIAITGLSANTTYYFLPFWAPLSSCNQVGWVIGTVGSPKIAFTVVTDPIPLAKQVAQNHEQLTAGYMSAATTASGTSGGGGGGGGAIGKCVMNGTDIEPLDGFEYSTEILPETDWVAIRAGGRELICTPDHPLYFADGQRVDAGKLEEGNIVTMRSGDFAVESVERFIRSCTKVKVSMKRGHLFWANDFLSHNFKQNLY